MLRIYKIFKLLVALSLMIFFSHLAIAEELSRYCPLQQGDSWEYSVNDDDKIYNEKYTVQGFKKINGIETIEMVFPDGSYECLASDAEGIKNYRYVESDGYGNYNPPLLVFPNKMKVGETKEYATEGDYYGENGEKKSSSSEKGQITLESIEDVTVPAGKFTGCLKFSLLRECIESGNRSLESHTIWFVSGVGKIRELSIATDYDSSGRAKANPKTIMYELVSAVIDGKEIGSQGKTAK